MTRLIFPVYWAQVKLGAAFLPYHSIIIKLLAAASGPLCCIPLPFNASMNVSACAPLSHAIFSLPGRVSMCAQMSAFVLLRASLLLVNISVSKIDEYNT